MPPFAAESSIDLDRLAGDEFARGVGEEEEGGTMLGFVQAAFAQEHPAGCPIKEGRWYAQLVPATVAALLGSSTTRAVTVGMYKQLLKACGVQADHPNFGVQHVVLRQGGAKGKKDDGDDAVCGECRRATLPDRTEVDSFVFHPEVLAAGGLPAAGPEIAHGVYAVMRRVNWLDVTCHWPLACF
jgi:hypothetical protein